ncbi:MAG: hypothetical protein RL199_1482, partial [Pseudomonadota bacterium]
MTRALFGPTLAALALAGACKAPIVGSPAVVGGDASSGAAPAGGVAAHADTKVGAAVGGATDVGLEAPEATYGADPRDVEAASSVGGSMGDAVHADLLPEEPPPPPLPADEPPFRSRRRLDLDQLDASLRRVTGFGWTEQRGSQEVNLFDELAASL